MFVRSIDSGYLVVKQENQSVEIRRQEDHFGIIRESTWRSDRLTKIFRFVSCAIKQFLPQSKGIVRIMFLLGLLICLGMGAYAIRGNNGIDL